MRSRAVVVLFVIAVIVLSFAVGLTLDSVVTPEETGGGTGGAGETTTPPPTPPPPATSPLSSFLDGVTGLLSDLLLIGALVLGALLVGRVVLRLVRLLRARQLVLENLANSSGSDDIGKSLTGLSQLAREQLSRQLRVILQEVRTNGDEGGAGSDHVYRSAPLVPVDEDDRRTLGVGTVPDVSTALNGTLDTLLESLKGIAPDRIKWVVELMKMAFPQRGVIVNGDLQRREDVPSRLGITLSVSDIDDRQNRRYFTVWEHVGGPSKAGSKEVSKETSEETSEETAGSTPTKETSTERTKETSEETTRGPDKAQPKVPRADPPSTGREATTDVPAEETRKETAKNTTKESSKETSSETSKTVSTSKETTKETSTGQRDLTRGYIGLLEPGCRWLACEISERERLADGLSIPLVPQTERRRPGQRAEGGA
jgi:hypothetical protein